MNYAALMINSFDLLVNLGWPEEERREKQTVKVDVELHNQAPPAACDTDDLKDTFCYAELITKIIHYTENKEFRLIEHLAKELHSLIKASGQYKAVIVHLTKHPSIKAFTGNVRFSYGG